MNVTYRLMGIDGEATEDTVENLQEGDEADAGNPAAAAKKFAIASCLTKNF